MKIAMIGTGYVGLVTGTLFADRGNDVICIDKNPTIVENLKKGIIHIHEPGLAALVEKNAGSTLHFSQDITDIKERDVIFLGVGTPSQKSGEFNLEYLEQAARDVAQVMNGKENVIIVTKSTVPQGTWKALSKIFDEHLTNWHYVSNPETLAEGTAVRDFSRPDRVIIGTESDYAYEKIKKIYEPFVLNNNPILKMHPASAELSKLGANTRLAMSVAFNNEMARICDETEGADYNEVRIGITTDERIGSKFSYASPGYGGSCFPKDVQGLAFQAHADKINLELLQTIHESNEYHKQYSAQKIMSVLKKENPHNDNPKIAIWGLTFKPKTDDMRDSASIPITEFLLKEGASISAYDPIDVKARQVLSKEIKFVENKYDAIDDADALVLLTEWSQFDMPDYEELKARMKGRILIDLRNRWNEETANQQGFSYYGMGRNYPL